MWMKWSASKLEKTESFENKGFSNHSSSLNSRNNGNAKHFAAILQYIQGSPNAGLNQLLLKKTIDLLRDPQVLISIP